MKCISALMTLVYLQCTSKNKLFISLLIFGLGIDQSKLHAQIECIHSLIYRYDQLLDL